VRALPLRVFSGARSRGVQPVGDGAAPPSRGCRRSAGSRRSPWRLWLIGLAISAALASLVALIRLRRGCRAGAAGTRNAEEPEKPADHEKPEKPGESSELADNLLKLDERWLRAVVLGGAGLIVLAGAVISFGDRFPSATVLVPTVFGLATGKISAGALVLGMAGAVVGWTLVLLAVLRTHWQVRVPAVVFLSLGVAFSPFDTGVRLVALAVIPALGALTLLVDRRAPSNDSGRSEGNRTWTFLVAGVVFSLVTAIYVSQAVRLGGVASTEQTSVSALEILLAVSVLIIPMLILAGANIGDLGGKLADADNIANLRNKRAKRAGARFQAVSSSILLGAGVAALALLAALRTIHGQALPGALLGGAVLAGACAVGVRTQPFKPRGKPQPALAFGAITFFVLLVAGGFAADLDQVPPTQILPPLRAKFVHTRQPVFSFRYPSMCGQPSEAGVPILATIYAISNCNPIQALRASQSVTFSYLVFITPGDNSKPCDTLGPLVGRRNARSAPDDGKWHTCVFHVGSNRGVAWSQRTGDWTVLLYGQANYRAFSSLGTLLVEIRDSWRPAVIPGPVPSAADETSSALIKFDRHVGYLAGVIWGISGIAATVVLVRRHRTGRPSEIAPLYFVTTSLWVAPVLIWIWADGNLRPAASLADLQIGGILAAVSIGTLAYIVFHAARRWLRRAARQVHRPAQDQVLTKRFGSLLVLNLTLLLLWGAAKLYAAAGSAGSAQAAAQGVIIMVALLWELAFSGDILNSEKADENTNPGEATENTSPGERVPVPQDARVLGYVGYLLLTASAVLQLGTLRSAATGARLEVFSPDEIVQIGIVELGVPLAITVCLLKWLSTDRSDPSGTANQQRPAAGSPSIQRTSTI